jgi:predicted transcriptional regulator
MKQQTPEEMAELRELLRGFISVSRAAKELGITPPAVRARIKHNTLLAARTQTGLAIPLEEIERLRNKYGDPASDIDDELKQLADA